MYNCNDELKYRKVYYKRLGLISELETVLGNELSRVCPYMF